MIVIPEHHETAPHARTHPWSKTEYDAGIGRYYDLKAQPELIRTSLEDFLPHSSQPSIQSFYELIESLNRPDGMLETNDCAFRAPEPHGNTVFRKQLSISGRLQLFFRQLESNCHRESITYLLRMFHLYLSLEHRDENYVIFETSLCPTDYVHIGRKGHRFSVAFYAYGDTEAEAWGRLETAFSGLRCTLERIEASLTVDIPEYP